MQGLDSSITIFIRVWLLPGGCQTFLAKPKGF